MVEDSRWHMAAGDTGIRSWLEDTGAIGSGSGEG